MTGRRKTHIRVCSSSLYYLLRVKPMWPEYKERERPQHLAMWIHLWYCRPHENMEMCINRAPFRLMRKVFITWGLGYNGFSSLMNAEGNAFSLKAERNCRTGQCSTLLLPRYYLSLKSTEQNLCGSWNALISEALWEAEMRIDDANKEPLDLQCSSLSMRKHLNVRES